MALEIIDLYASGSPVYGVGAGDTGNGVGPEHVPGPVLAAYCQGLDFPPTGCRATTVVYSYWADGCVHGSYLYLIYGGGAGLGNRIYRYILSVVGGQVTATYDSSVLVSDILAGANNWVWEGAIQYDGTNVILCGMNSTVGAGRTPVIGKWAMSSWPFTAANAIWLSPVALSTGSYVAGQITCDGTNINSPIVYLGPTYLYVISSRSGQVHVINPSTGAVVGNWVYAGSYNTTEVYQFQMWGETGGKIYGGNMHASAGTGSVCRWDISNPNVWVNEAVVFLAGYYTFPNPVLHARRGARGLDGRSCAMRPVSRYQIDLLDLPASCIMWWEADNYSTYGQAVVGIYDTATDKQSYRSVPQDPNRRSLGNCLSLFYAGGFLRDFMMVDGYLWFMGMSQSSLEHETEQPGLYAPYQRGMLGTPIGPVGITFTVPPRSCTPKSLHLILPPGAVNFVHAADWSKYRARLNINGGGWSAWRSGPQQLTHLDQEVDGIAAWPSWINTDTVQIEVQLCSGWPYDWGGVVKCNPGGAFCSDAPQMTGSAAPGMPREVRPVLAIDSAAGVALSALVPSTMTVQEGGTEEMVVVMSEAVGGDVVVTLSSSDPTKATVPPSVTVTAGNQTAAFTLTAVGFGATVVTASYLGVDKTAAVTVQPVEIAAVAPDEAEVLVESTVSAQVVFEAPVVRNEVVALSSDPGVTVPASVTILTGQQAASFNVVANSLGSATITATHSTGVKTCDIVVVARGYGPSDCGHRPTILSSERLVPTILSSEKL